jgi:AAA domain (dynein-related subfamily)
MTSPSRKPRDLASVEPYKNDQGQARCRITLATGEVVPLRTLTRPEISAAARMLFHDLPGNAWLRFKTEQVETWIRENDRAGAAAAIAAYKMPQKLAPEPKPLAPEDLETLTRSFNQVTAPTVHYYDVVVEPPVKPTVFIDEVGEPYAEPVHVEPVKPLAPEEQALLDAFRSSRKGVDLEQVQAIVTAEVKRQVIEQGVTRIEVKARDGEVRELPPLHHALLPELVTILGETDLNILLVGPAGSGKSTLVEQAASALGFDFYALSMGPTTPTSKIFGYMDAQGRAVRTPSWDGFEHGGVILWDELDNGHPGLVAEGNQMLSNGYAAFASGMVRKHDDSRFVATANTFGTGPDRQFVGRNILDAATLDRFLVIEVPIDEKLEAQAARQYVTDESLAAIESWITYVRQVRARVTDLKLPVIVSPRATIGGAQLLAAGLDVERVKAMRLFKGLSKEVISKIG